MKDQISLAVVGKCNPVHLQVKTLKATASLANFNDFSWERILADRKHLLEGTDEEVEKKKRDSASRDN